MSGPPSLLIFLIQVEAAQIVHVTKSHNQQTQCPTDDDKIRQHSPQQALQQTDKFHTKVKGFRIWYGAAVQRINYAKGRGPYISFYYSNDKGRREYYIEEKFK